MAINDDIMKQVSSFTSNDQLNDFFRNTNYSPEQLAAASGYSQSDIQARMDAVRQTGGSSVNPYDTGPGDDYKQQIQADLAKLNGATDADLNSYLSSTKFSPEQLAEVSGYNASDLAARMNQARPPANVDNSGYLNWYDDVKKAYEAQAGGPNAKSADEFADWHWQNYGQKEGRYGYNPIDPKAAPGMTEAVNNPGLKSYVRDNPQLAKDYESSLFYGTKGYTFEEYVARDWLEKGAPEGYGISLQPNGTYGFDAPKEDLFKSQFTDEQQKGIAQFYVNATRGSEAAYDGSRAILGAMAEYGVSRQELTNALAKYGMESIPEHSRPQGNYFGGFDAKHIDDLIDTQAREVGLHEGFGGPSAMLTKAHRALTPEEQNRFDFRQANLAYGSYGQNRGNVPGRMIADGVNLSMPGAYVTARDLAGAQSGGHLYYQKANGEWSDARTDPNWRKDLAEKSESEKARWAGLIKAGEGKVSPFVSGPQSGKNAPGKGVAELAPGLMVNGIRPNSTTTTRTTSTPTTPTTTTTPGAPAPAPAKPFDGTVPTERLAEARRYGLDLNQLTQQELATFVNSGWAGLSQSRQAEWNKQAANRPANPNLMS